MSSLQADFYCLLNNTQLHVGSSSFNSSFFFPRNKRGVIPSRQPSVTPKALPWKQNGVYIKSEEITKWRMFPMYERHQRSQNTRTEMRKVARGKAPSGLQWGRLVTINNTSVINFCLSNV